MVIAKALIAVILLQAFVVLPIAQAATAREVAERAQEIERALFPSGSPENYLDVKVNPAPGRTRQFLTVLPGVLYRGGGPGGQKPLGHDSLKELCEAGFGLAVYGYTEKWVPVQPIECLNKVTGRPNTIRYVSGNANDSTFKSEFLKLVQVTIMDAAQGAVFVHCWNGMHASGELAAVALRQFCDWDGDSASNYWLRHAGGFPMISRIRKFTPSAALSLPGDIQDEICRQRQ